MKISIISFTDKGAEQNINLTKMLKKEGYKVTGYCYASYKRGGLLGFEKLKDLIKTIFAEQDGILFIGAVAIGVRGIAPFLQGKEKDPAVLVMDEKGNYIISLLSGHLGGGNDWCNHMAFLTGAVPVITTATDLYGKFAVDTFARENHLKIPIISLIKEISGRILAEKRIGFYSELPVEGELPKGLQIAEMEELEAGICISYDEKTKKFPLCCNLVPMDLVVGIGCRRGKTKEEIMEFLLSVLKKFHLSKYRIGKICSIDRKAKEEGIQEVAKEYLVPFITYSKEQLLTAEGEFAASDFVLERVGIDNVCERSAVIGMREIWNQTGELIVPKHAKDGITIAIAKREVKICFM